MRHLSDAATAWELEAERRREVLDADASRAQARDDARIAAGPGFIERLLGRLRIDPSSRESSIPVCDAVAPVKPAG